MKKELKKQIEHELTEAIIKVLSAYNTKAIDNAKKAVKEASKSVAKKYTKTLKQLSEKTKEKNKKDVASKVSVAKKETSEKIIAKKVAVLVPSNGVHKSGKGKIALRKAFKKKQAHSAHNSRRN